MELSGEPVPIRDIRRDPRLASGDPVRVSWEDGSAGQRFASGKCIDVSASGLKIEVLTPIPVHTNVMIRAEGLGLSGPAVVKHSLRRGTKYVVGVQLSEGRLTGNRESREKR
jgi:hypothetical protein